MIRAVPWLKHLKRQCSRTTEGALSTAITSKVVARWPIQRVKGAGALIDYLRTVKLLYKKETSAIPFSFIRWRAIKGEQGR